MSLSYLVHLANYSDGVLYLLLVLFTIELAVIFDRLLYLRGAMAEGRKVLWTVSNRGKLQRQDLEEIARMAAGRPEESLLKVALRHFNLIHHYGSARGEAFANRLDEAIFLTTPSLDRRLWILDTIVTLAPLLGLFGTILGMFHAFSILAAPGHSPDSVTGGVADALIATASGLFIAMIGLLGYNAFNNAIDKTIFQLESLKVVLMNRLDGAPVVLEEAAVEAPAAGLSQAVAQ